MSKASKLIEFIDQTSNKIDTFGNRVGVVKEKGGGHPMQAQDKNPMKNQIENPKRINIGNKSLSKYLKKKEDNPKEDKGKKKEYLMYPMIKQIPGSEG